MVINEQSVVDACKDTTTGLTFATSNTAVNERGDAHVTLTGKFVRQGSKESALLVARDIVLSEIATYVFENARSNQTIICFRIWPEVSFGGVNDVYARWYTRLSIYPALEMAA